MESDPSTTHVILGASSSPLDDVDPYALSRLVMALDQNARLEDSDPGPSERQPLTGQDGTNMLQLYEQMAGVRIDRDSVEGSLKGAFSLPVSEADREAAHTFFALADRLRMQRGLARYLQNRLESGAELDAHEVAMQQALKSPEFDFRAFMEQQFPLEDETLDDDAVDFVSRIESLTLEEKEEEGECSTDSMPELV
jgi:hypothetical protein